MPIVCYVSELDKSVPLDAERLLRLLGVSGKLSGPHFAVYMVEQVQEKQSGTLLAMTTGTLKDTPALDALKASCGAPISMGRGEIPVRLAATSRLFCLRIYSQKSVSEQERTLGSALSLIHITQITAYFMEGGVAYDRS